MVQRPEERFHYDREGRMCMHTDMDGRKDIPERPDRQEDTYYRDGLNLYQYCANNPVMYQDPWRSYEGGNGSVIYGTDDIAKYKYNMIENPGPLADMQGNPASNFYGGRYNVETLMEDKIYYRGGNSDKALGQWFVTKPPESVAKVRIDTAVKPQWIDPITGKLTGESVVDTVYAIKIPKGTKVYTGPVGTQGGAYCGGYDIMQSFIKEPWKLDCKVISSSPLS